MSNRKPYIAPVDRPEARDVGRPEPGYYEVQLRSGAATVGARILHEPTRDPDTGRLLDRSWYWHGVINGQPDPKPSPAPTERTWRIWHNRSLRPVTRERYEWLIAHREWARENAPGTPEADPYRKPDPMTGKLTF